VNACYEASMLTREFLKGLLMSYDSRLVVECPRCHGKVNVGSPDVKKVEGGLNLIVTCPHCGAEFEVQRVMWVRERLRAEYGYVKEQQGHEQRVSIRPS
jgi:endogenous inhibitor of DNA gyrase (YacG/DUF329 family)